MTVDAEAASAATDVLPWDPVGALTPCRKEEVIFSRGFLRAKPEKWFPGLHAQWLPLAHTFDREFQISKIKPSLDLPKQQGALYTAVVDQSPVGLFIEASHREVLLETLLPKSHLHAKEISADYLARRFLISLVRAWSGTEFENISVGLKSSIGDYFGSIHIELLISDVAIELSLLVTKNHIEMLDGMWRRQTSSFKKLAGSSELRLQVAELAVPIHLLNDYTRRGAIIDLETPENHMAVLFRGDDAWQKVQLCSVDEVYAIRIVDQVPQPASLPPETARVSIELGHFISDPEQIAELSQIGAIMPTPLELTNAIELRVNGELRTRGRLGLYQDRFAVMVE